MGVLVEAISVVRASVNVLESRALRFWDGKECLDIAVVDEYQGPTATCSWLEGGRHPAGFSVYWMRGTPPSPAACPAGWKLGQSAKLQFVPTADVPDRLLPLVSEGTVDVFLDYTSGREVYVGRASPWLIGPLLAGSKADRYLT